MHMRWWQRMLTLLRFGRRTTSGEESTAAVVAANLSHERAVEDRCRATAQRAEAEIWATQVRNHNTANRYDDFLRRVMKGDA